VHALAALERAQRERAEDARARPPVRAVAAQGAREPHPPELLEQHLQVAQREAGDRGQQPGRPEPLGAAQDLRRRGRPCEHAGREHGERRLGGDAEREPQPVADDKREQDHEEHERRLDRQAPGEHRRRHASGDRHGREQRRVDRVRPHQMPAGDQRDGEDEQHGGEHLRLGRRAMKRRLDGRFDGVVPAHFTITVDM
jgi:hypothetical protein